MTILKAMFLLTEIFRTTIDVRQVCIFFPLLFHNFLEIKQRTFQEHHTIISVGRRAIGNLRFADVLDVLPGNDREQPELTANLSTSAATYCLKIRNRVLLSRASESMVIMYGRATLIS